MRLLRVVEANPIIVPRLILPVSVMESMHVTPVFQRILRLKNFIFVLQVTVWGIRKNYFSTKQSITSVKHNDTCMGNQLLAARRLAEVFDINTPQGRNIGSNVEKVKKIKQQDQ